MNSRSLPALRSSTSRRSRVSPRSSFSLFRRRQGTSISSGHSPGWNALATGRIRTTDTAPTRPLRSSGRTTTQRRNRKGRSFAPDDFVFSLSRSPVSGYQRGLAVKKIPSPSVYSVYSVVENFRLLPDFSPMILSRHDSVSSPSRTFNFAR
ncbi:hypothetical protein SBV1_1240020 [Verrucomicrobia bacterium]|nr:hypothetical protein SBV1_1240020 [Verrucomicrobiota bacterium]